MEESIDKRQALAEIYQKLERRSRLNRWLTLTLGIFATWVAFSYPGLGEASGFLKSLAEIPASFLFAAFAGAALGSSLSNWSGSDELKLAEALLIVTAEE